MKYEILISQIWKSNYAEVYYKVLQTSKYDVEMYDLDNIWNCIKISKKELNNHFILKEDFFELSK